MPLPGSTAALRLLITSVTRGLALLPRSAALCFGRFLGWIFGSVIRHHRADARDALDRSLPEVPERERRRIESAVYRNAAVNYIEVLRLAGGAKDDLNELIAFEGEEHVRAALARGKGALVLTGHVGNFDLLAMYAAQRGYPLTVVSKEIRNPAVNDFWMRFRERFGVKIVLSHNSLRACLKALKDDGLLGFVLDQNRPRDQGVFVTFFGRPACTTPGLAFIAAAAQAPVVPAFMYRTPDDRHRLVVFPPIDPPPDREEDTLRRATQVYASVVEEAIRRQPDQWIWMHRRWKTQPNPGDVVATPEPA
jgi:KDO2-lipid IV(A) lauroyltransferase